MARPAARARGLLASLSLASLASLALPGEAAAWEPLFVNASMACIQQGIPFGRFSSGSIDVVLHTGACPDRADEVVPGSDTVLNSVICRHEDEPVKTEALRAMMEKVHAQVAQLAGVDISFRVTTSEDVYVHGDWFGDVRPTIHVGLFDHLIQEEGGGTAGMATPRHIDACTWDEAHIMLTSTRAIQEMFSAVTEDTLALTAGTPSTRSAENETAYFEVAMDSYEVGETRVFALEWLYAHELLHALGLNHVNEVYSVSNYGVSPWIETSAGVVAVPLLPDDVTALRTLYPAPGAADEETFFLTNSWISDGAEVQAVGEVDACLHAPIATYTGDPTLGSRVMTCSPAFGDGFHDALNHLSSIEGPYDDFDSCGGYGQEEGPVVQTTVDEWLYTNVTLNNTSAHPIDVELSLYISEDDVLDVTSDTRSPTIRTVRVPAETSRNVSRRFSVPATPEGLTLRPILSGTTAGGTHHAIPLHDTIEGHTPSWQGPTLLPGGIGG